MLQLKECPESSKGECDQVLAGEYDVEGLDLGDKPKIIDCGANIGSFILWAKHKWPAAVIDAYEPNPDAYKLLQKNVDGFSSVYTHMTAVGKADGTVPLFIPTEGCSLGNASLKQLVGGKQDMAKAHRVSIVHARTLPACDLLKIDTEGSETDILFFYPHLQKCKSVVLEWHSHHDREQIRQFMWQQGFALKEDREDHWAGFGHQKWVKSTPAAPAAMLYVCVLAGGGKVCIEHQQCVEALRSLAPTKGIAIQTVAQGGTGVDRARNAQIAAALKTGATHFMFIDDDIVFDPQYVVNMVNSGLDVVCGGYPRKEMDWSRVAKAVKDGIPDCDLKYYANSHIYNHIVDNDGGMNGRSMPGIGDFVEVEEVGTGFLMFKMDVVRTLIKKHEADMAYLTDYEPRDEVHHMLFACQRDPDCPVEVALTKLKKAALAFKNNDPSSNARTYDLMVTANAYAEAVADGAAAIGRYLTEDYAFCRLHRMNGGKIYLYVDADLGHIGSFKFEGQVRHTLKKADTPQPEVGPI